MNPPTETPSGATGGEKTSSGIDFDDLGKRISRGFDQVKQYAVDTMSKFDGTAEGTTDFPEEFVQLDEQLDSTKTLFDQLMRTVRQVISADNYSPPIGDTIKSAMDKFQTRLSSASVNESASAASQKGDDGKPATVQHAVAAVCLEGAHVLEGSSGAASEQFTRYGQIMMELGHARMEFNEAAMQLFVEPFETYSGAYDVANNARKNARKVREGLDNLKRKIKDREENAKKSKTTESPQTASDTMNMKEECDVMQASFDEACQQAIQDMQAFIQYTEATHCIEALIQAQVEYHEKALKAIKSHN